MSGNSPANSAPYFKGLLTRVQKTKAAGGLLTMCSERIVKDHKQNNIRMKSRLPWLLLASLLLSPFFLRAQKKEAPVFDKLHKNIYGELRGSHLLSGVNFDMRLKKGRMDGIGLRAGLGGASIPVEDANNDFQLGLVTFPIEFNHVVGRRRSSFVAGAGILPVYATISGQGEISDNEFVRGEGLGITGGFLTFGYRLQPLRNGFMMQLHWNPLVLRASGFSAGWFGLGMGFGFK